VGFAPWVVTYLHAWALTSRFHPYQ